MVFSINIRGLLFNIPTDYFEFFRNAREPIVIVSEVVSFFPSLTLTAVIPNIDNLELKNAEITPYVDAVPAIYLGPELLISTEPTVIQTVAELLADLPTNAQEIMFTESQFYPVAYIQYNICDFGLKVLPADNTDDVFTIQG